MGELTDLQTRVLVALVEGYLAREGMKDRIRALNEWEIARRSGYTDASYAEYLEHPTREVVMAALSALQGLGLVTVWDRGVKYDTFVPTETGTQTVMGALVAVVPGVSSGESSGSADVSPLAERLDEIIRLLRSIDAKLGGR